MQLRSVYRTIGQSKRANPLQLSPATCTIELSQAPDFTDLLSNCNDFDIADLARNLKRNPHGR